MKKINELTKPLENAQVLREKGLSLSDFSFSKSQKNLENCKYSFSDAIIEEITN